MLEPLRDVLQIRMLYIRVSPKAHDICNKDVKRKIKERELNPIYI